MCSVVRCLTDSEIINKTAILATFFVACVLAKGALGRLLVSFWAKSAGESDPTDLLTVLANSSANLN